MKYKHVIGDDDSGDALHIELRNARDETGQFWPEITLTVYIDGEKFREKSTTSVKTKYKNCYGVLDEKRLDDMIVDAMDQFARELQAESEEIKQSEKDRNRRETALKKAATRVGVETLFEGQKLHATEEACE